MQVTRNENHTPTAFHANIVAMEKGLVGVEDVADDYVHCTQCGACELRCPNTLMLGDFYRHRTRTVDVVKAMRALMVATGNEREGWKLWNERLAEDHNEPVLGDVRGLPGARRRLGRGPRHPGRRRDDPVRRLRGGVLPDLLHARLRAAAAGRGRRVRADARAVVLRRPGGRDGLRRPRAQARRAQRRRLARGRREADHRPRPARLHRLHRGLPALLRRRLRVRDRPRRRAASTTSSRRAGSRSPSRSSAPSPTTTRAGSTSARASTRRRASCCGRCRGSSSSDVDHVTQWSYCSGGGGGLPIEKPEITAEISRRRVGARAGARGRHADQRVPVVGAAAVGGRRRRRAAARGDGPVRARRAVGGDRGRRPHARAGARGAVVSVAFKSAVDDARRRRAARDHRRRRPRAAQPQLAREPHARPGAVPGAPLGRPHARRRRAPAHRAGGLGGRQARQPAAASRSCRAPAAPGCPTAPSRCAAGSSSTSS